jgi:hypothetical protein
MKPSPYGSHGFKLAATPPKIADFHEQYFAILKAVLFVPEELAYVLFQ